MSRLSIFYDSPIKKQHIGSLVYQALQREKRLLLAALMRTKDILKKFEAKYNMPSDQFFELYQAGKTDDRDDYVDWAGEYHIYRSIEEKIKDFEELTVEYN